MWGATVWQQAKPGLAEKLSEAEVFDLDLADTINPGRNALSLVSWLFDCEELSLIEPGTAQAVFHALKVGQH